MLISQWVACGTILTVCWIAVSCRGAVPLKATKCQSLPQSVYKVPQSIYKVPQSIYKVPQSINKVSQSINKLPQSITKDECEILGAGWRVWVYTMFDCIRVDKL